MAQKLGTSIRANFEVIVDNPDTPDSVTLAATVKPFDCCFMLPALAEEVFTSQFNNDSHAHLFFWNNAFDSAEMVLERFINGGWVSWAGLSNDAYGTFFPFWYHSTIFGEKSMGYKLDFAKVLDLIGEGTFRIRGTGSKILGGTVDRYSLDFCLKTYTPARAENTVRVDWTLNGLVGDEDNDEKHKDYSAINFVNQLRLPKAMFTQIESDFSTESVKYSNGSITPTKNEQVENYLLACAQMPNVVIRFLRINAFQSKELLITDFNSSNPTPMTLKKVAEPSGFEQTLVPNVDKMKWAINFKPKFQNLSAKNC